MMSDRSGPIFRNRRGAYLSCAASFALMASPAALAQATANPSDVADSSQGPSNEIVVTAQKRSETIQNVPISMSAFSSDALLEKQIRGFDDLQFSAPAVTFSQGNYGGNNFQIRGIGLSSIGNTSDTGVAVHIDDVYLLQSASLATGEYFDLDRVEVLRGPQSTLYGRNATGGTVNLVTAKPNASALAGSVDAELGTRGTVRVAGMLNVPLVSDTLALRVAGVYAHHDGYVRNVTTGNDVNSKDLYSLRGALRWTPGTDTTIDVMYQYSRESDSHMRSPKQLCHRDPSGVLGCLPDRLAFEAVNGNAQVTNIAASTALLGPFGFVNLNLNAPDPVPGGNANALVPQSLFQIATDVDPQFRSKDQLAKLAVQQRLADWLTATAVVAYQKSSYSSIADINSIISDDISVGLSNALATFQGAFGPLATTYIDRFFSGPQGTSALPVSGLTGNGLVGGNIVDYSNRLKSIDNPRQSSRQSSYEFRLSTDSAGPLNGLLAGYYLEARARNNYIASSTGLDYASIMLGRLSSLSLAPTDPTGVYLLGPGFNLDSPLYRLKSKAVFGELYYDVIPDRLKITAGLRYLEDSKREVSRQGLFATLVPYGTLDNDAVFEANGVDFDASRSGNQLYADQRGKFKALTGRFVVDWKPDVSFTDSTLIYASYSRGFKSGGINPPQRTVLAYPTTFAPEKINAVEIGTKNRLLGNRLTMNLSAYYYDYSGLQVAKLINRAAVNENIDASVWGLEGEFQYQVTPRLQLSLNAATTQTRIGDGVRSVNLRNPGEGLPNAVVIKGISSDSLGASCVVLMDPSTGNVTPGDAGVAGFSAPAGGSGQLAQYGVPHVNYGRCTGALPAGYSFTPNVSGVEADLGGNRLPQTPSLSFTLGAEYTLPVGANSDLVARADYYVQNHMWGRIYNDAADRISSWSSLNLSLQLNLNDGNEYVRLFCSNCTNSRGLTGMFLADSNAGLYNNVFVQDPRVVGVSAGARF